MQACLWWVGYFHKHGRIWWLPHTFSLNVSKQTSRTVTSFISTSVSWVSLQLLSRKWRTITGCSNRKQLQLLHKLQSSVQSKQHIRPVQASSHWFCVNVHDRPDRLQTPNKVRRRAPAGLSKGEASVHQSRAYFSKDQCVSRSLLSITGCRQHICAFVYFLSAASKQQPDTKLTLMKTTHVDAETLKQIVEVKGGHFQTLSC